MYQITNDLKELLALSWPVVAISCIVLVSLRITHIIKNKTKPILYEELLVLLFVIYTLCLFQIVTYQDVSDHGFNLILFRELTRYNVGSRLFFRNVIGNICLFIPYGFFASYYLKITKKRVILLLIFLTSLSIEIIQSLIGRAFDIDDILLNLIGGILGYFIYRIINKVTKKIPDNLKGNLLLVFFIVIAIILLMILL